MRNYHNRSKLLKHLRERKQRCFILLQTFGEGTKDGAYLISAADAGLVDKAKAPIMAALEGKGGGKGGRFQGKCANLAGADAAVAAAADALGA